MSKEQVLATEMDLMVKNRRVEFKANKHKYNLFVQLCNKNGDIPSDVLRKAVDSYIKSQKDYQKSLF